MKTRPAFLSYKLPIFPLTACLLSVMASTALAAPSTIRASVSSAEVQGNGDSGGTTFNAIAISGNGRYVVFASDATNLVPGDTNGESDVFIRDLTTGLTRRVSVSSSGGQGNGSSGDPSISPDGRYVAFSSFSNNLVPGDTNNATDVFVRDLRTGVTQRASLDDAENEGNNTSWGTSISADGRFVAFTSEATNLVANDTNEIPDIFVRDLRAGVTRRASVDSSGIEGDDWSQEAVISGNGRYVAFQSFANNLVPDDATSFASDVYVHDLKTGETRLVSAVDPEVEPHDCGGFYTGTVISAGASISADGRYVSFQSFDCHLVANDNNAAQDIFVRDLKTETTRRASVNSDEVEGNGDIFTASYSAAISGNGRFVAFTSSSNNLVPGDNNSKDDVFIRDLQLGTTRRVSVATLGTESNDDSGSPSVSNGGRVAFNSGADNLVPGDSNGFKDVFVRLR
ncbi:MAG: TolB family protein [Methylosarcina sp.]